MPPPSAQALPALLSKIRTTLPASIPKSAAYILPASTLTALGHPNLLGPLFLNVTGLGSNNNNTGKDGATPPPPPSHPAVSPSEARTISLHLRDMLLKEWTLIGIPLVITAVASLSAAERTAGLFPPLDQHPTKTKNNDDGNNTTTTTNEYPLGTTSTLSPRFSTGDLSLHPPTAPLPTRGTAHLHRLYTHHLPSILATWGAHEADFTWLEEAVIYGAFLADHSVLTEVETSLVTVASMLAQGLKAPALWHLRGLRRLGVGRGEVEGVVRGVGEVVAWAGGRVGGATGAEGEVGEWVGWVGEVEGEI